LITWALEIVAVINKYFVLTAVLLNRINTFGTKVIVGTNEDGTPIYHPIHEFGDTLWNIYLEDFKRSKEFAELCRQTGRTTISFSKFREGALACPCIRQPTMRVCVDETETAFSELTYCLKEIQRRSQNVCACGFCTNEQRREDEEEGIKYFLCIIYHLLML
jgi:hypothetical protein